MADIINDLDIVLRRIEQLNGFDEEAEVIDYAISLLKEQEPVEPKKIPVDPLSYDFYYAQCGNCGKFLPFIKQKYCHECGRAVKWE